MKIDFNVVLLDIEYKPMTQPIFKEVQAKDKKENPAFYLPNPSDGGKPIPVLITVVSDKEKVTLGMVARSALLMGIEGEKIGGLEKQKLWDIAYEIKQSEKKKEPLDVDDDDLTCIRDRVGKIHTIAYVGAARPYLVTTEGKKKKKKP